MKKSIDTRSEGDITFEITAENNKNLEMLSKYAKQVDSFLDEKPNFDGLINYIISRGCEVVFKDIAKAHGVKVSTLYETISRLGDDDILKQIQYLGKMQIVSFAQKIIQEQPYIDAQKELFNGGEK